MGRPHGALPLLANGKVLLAYDAGAAARRAARAAHLADGRRSARLARSSPDRREGFAAATDELELGLSAVAAPVFDEKGRVVAALSVSGPTLRLTPKRIAELRPS